MYELSSIVAGVVWFGVLCEIDGTLVSAVAGFAGGIWMLSGCIPLI